MVLFMALVFGVRGQEAAPFELLVAVIIMGFVLTVGAILMDQWHNEQCKMQIDNALQDLKVNIQSTTNDGFPTRFTFRLPAGCFKESEVKLKVHGNAPFCSSLCGDARDSCVALEYKSKGYSTRLCVNIPKVTNFKDQSSPGECRDRSTEDPPYELFDLHESIPMGNYEMFNVTPPNHAFPVVCAYRKGRQ